jgi:hypothetical protein
MPITPNEAFRRRINQIQVHRASLSKGAVRLIERGGEMCPALLFDSRAGAEWPRLPGALLGSAQ